jgi:hypothetical protein
MPRLYRIQTVGSDGQYVGIPRDMECADDEDAVAKATQAVDGLDVELWDMLRIVARLPGKAPKA